MKNDRTSAGDAFSVLAFTVLRLAGQITAAGDALAKPSGQSSARWQVLAAAEHGSLTVADTGRILGLARQGIQRIADTLEKEGYISYAGNPAHQRAKLLTLTASGRESLDDIQARQAVWANALGAELGEQDLRKAAATLGRFLERLQEERQGKA